MTKEPASIRLAPDLSFAENSDGERISFTRSEKRALRILAQHPNRILTRNQILDAVSGGGSDSQDRNVDFLINRLRRKLLDNPREPRFIATHYGEGYMWIWESRNGTGDHSGAYLVVGPLRGVENLEEHRAVSQAFASHLCGTLRAELPPTQQVVFVPDYAGPGNVSGAGPSLSIELTFFKDASRLNCVAAARQSHSRRILAIHRLALAHDDLPKLVDAAASAAKTILANIWRALATQTDAGIPLPVLMHQASTHPPARGRGAPTDSDRQLSDLVSLHENRIMAAWKDNEIRLRHLLNDSPGDATLKVLYATHIHSKYIQFGYRLFQSGIDERRRDEDDIETLVHEALPHIQSHPEYTIMAAKLLHFLQRGYFGLARDLSEEAYAASVSAAGSLAIIGQFRAYSGETVAALQCLDQALNLVKPASSEHFYTLTIKLQTLHAAGDFERLDDAKRELYRMSVTLMLLYEPLFAHPEKLSLRAKAVTMALSRNKALSLLNWQNYVSARLFRDPVHRQNAIGTLLALVVRRFGTNAIPSELRAAYPRLQSDFS